MQPDQQPAQAAQCLRKSLDYVLRSSCGLTACASCKVHFNGRSSLYHRCCEVARRALARRAHMLAMLTKFSAHTICLMRPNSLSA